MSSFVTTSGLSVVYSSDEAAIGAALKQLDPHLFLDKDRAPAGTVHFVVREWDKNRSPMPVTILDWTHDRKQTGHPIPLDFGIVQEVEERKRFWGVDLGKYVREQNAAHEAGNDAEAAGELQEVTDYYTRRLRLASGQNSRRFFPVGEQGSK